MACSHVCFWRVSSPVLINGAHCGSLRWALWHRGGFAGCLGWVLSLGMAPQSSGWRLSVWYAAAPPPPSPPSPPMQVAVHEPAPPVSPGCRDYCPMPGSLRLLRGCKGTGWGWGGALCVWKKRRVWCFTTGWRLHLTPLPCPAEAPRPSYSGLRTSFHLTTASFH